MWKITKTHNMGNGLFSVDITLHDTILIDTDGGQEIEGALVAGVDTVENKADHDLLPSWATLVPELGLLQVDNVTNVLHDTVQRTGSKHLIFVVVCNSDEQLSMTIVHGWAQIVTILESEVVGITCCSRV